MKETKFRAWDNINKKMYVVLAWQEGAVKVEDNSNEDGVFITCNYKLIQYTGLKDKNEVEIYEGDIVKYTRAKAYDEEDREEIIQHVFYLAGAWTPVLWMHWEYHDFDERPMAIRDIEVIGNIYENPALLKEAR